MGKSNIFTRPVASLKKGSHAPSCAFPYWDSKPPSASCSPPAALAEVVPSPQPLPRESFGSHFGESSPFLKNHQQNSPAGFCFLLGLPWDSRVLLHRLQHFPFGAAP